MGVVQAKLLKAWREYMNIALVVDLWPADSPKQLELLHESPRRGCSLARDGGRWSSAGRTRRSEARPAETGPAASVTRASRAIAVHDLVGELLINAPTPADPEHRIPRLLAAGVPRFESIGEDATFLRNTPPSTSCWKGADSYAFPGPLDACAATSRVCTAGELARNTTSRKVYTRR